MTTKLEKGETRKEIKGEVLFKNLDPHVGRFELEPHKLLVSNRTFDLPASVFPSDFAPTQYEVTGTYKIEISIKRK